MRRPLLLALTLVVVVGGGIFAWLWWRARILPAYEPPSVRRPVPPVEGELRLAVTGDWGSGLRPQWEVAQAMDRAARRVGGLHGGLLLGDNFYMKGIQGVEDPLIRAYFEEVYDTEYLGLLTWHVVLGNHDYDGVARAQIEYTATSNGRWHMPSEFFRLDLPSPEEPLLTVLGLDTNDRCPRWPEQVAWLDTQLASLRDAPQIVVAIAHHPIASYAQKEYRVERQVTAEITPRLLNAGSVDVYFAGHAHCMELIDHQGQMTAVIGSGGKQLYPVVAGEGTQFHRSTYGFGLLTVTPGRLRLEFIDTTDRVLHTWEHVREPADRDD
ncbi:MAG: metallophosphoesterase [Planctomycetota bacterium]